MMRTRIRPVVVAVVVMLALLVATPALAQRGGLRGFVVDEDGQPVGQVRVNFINVADPNKKQSAISDRFGEYIRNNLDVGLWNLEAERFGKAAKYYQVTVKDGESRRIPNLVLGDPDRPPVFEESALDNDEIAKRNARLEELNVLFAQAEVSTTRGDYDDALAKLTEIAGEIENCAACYARMGDVYRRKKDLDAAEKAFKQAIDMDPKLVDPYMALAELYNEQRRYEEATAMGAKAAELAGASGSATGGGAAAYNQAVILWNQNKIAEAAEAFDRARKTDPKMAAAHFRYALAMFNLGRLPEAKEPLETYLKLEPNGENAAEAKALLEVIK
ncbi:MAG TPA: tetratricopeptide repeat protein [Vicinamibacterales bacterium]|nr:tetratricopeptide repeat protein [Vicinamibacterales bacterium]